MKIYAERNTTNQFVIISYSAKDIKREFLAYVCPKHFNRLCKLPENNKEYEITITAKKSSRGRLVCRESCDDIVKIYAAKEHTTFYHYKEFHEITGIDLTINEPVRIYFKIQLKNRTKKK